MEMDLREDERDLTKRVLACVLHGGRYLDRRPSGEQEVVREGEEKRKTASILIRYLGLGPTCLGKIDGSIWQTIAHE